MSQVKIPFGRRPTVGDGAGDGPRRDVQTVSRLVRGAHALLEGRYSNLWVQGEISGLKIATTGHAYFNLVDAQSSISVAMWQSAVRRLRFRLEEGQEVLLRGSLGIYARSGRFQLYAQTAEPAGAGARALAFEQIKTRLQAEGLFDPARKQPLPRWPRKIGVVTSAQGAALQDILKVGRTRCPMRYVVSHARVQGDGAAQELLTALTRVAAVPEVDVILVSRGGGSADDLAAFNDEGLARAIAACRVPVVSAVGHEVDVSICDFVADQRAATPSHGAEIVVPDAGAIVRRLGAQEDALDRVITQRLLEPRRQLDHATYRLERGARALVEAQRRRAEDDRARARAVVRARITAAKQRRDSLHRRLAAAHPARQVRLDKARLTDLERRLQRAAKHACHAPRLRLTAAMARLHAMSPLAVLGRGYALVSDANGALIHDATEVAVGDALDVRVARGRLSARVDEVHEG